MTSIKDVAKAAGVSTATVSWCFANNAPSGRKPASVCSKPLQAKLPPQPDRPKFARTKARRSGWWFPTSETRPSPPLAARWKMPMSRLFRADVQHR
ncbi:MAG: LacI family DNA-binding transcriptional regulator [Anaerolineales bacterium]|nr:LacI family DNA-binding transcriptional regulator [Anaerolineales bacterium]